MFCGYCGTELADDATFCSNCGNRVRAKKSKNVYIALVLTFFITGLGSIYAGNRMKGLALLIVRIAFAVLAVFMDIFVLLSVLVWTYAFYEAYRDVQIANGHHNPRLVKDFKTWSTNKKIMVALIICVILIFTVSGGISFLTMDSHSPADSTSHYYTSYSGSGGSSYGGVDTSPNAIAKSDPDWYYDYYEYGDDPDIDDYLESEGYD